MPTQKELLELAKDTELVAMNQTDLRALVREAQQQDDPVAFLQTKADEYVADGGPPEPTDEMRFADDDRVEWVTLKIPVMKPVESNRRHRWINVNMLKCPSASDNLRWLAAGLDRVQATVATGSRVTTRNPALALRWILENLRKE